MIKEIKRINYKSLPREEFESWLDGYITFEPSLLTHQLASVCFALGEGLTRVMFTNDIGTCKTYTSLALSMCWKPKGRILVVCPNTVVYTTWEKQVKKYTNYDFEVLTGTKLEREKTLFTTNKDMYIINYEGLRVLFWDTIENNKGTKKGVVNLARIKQAGFEQIIFDEMHHLKDETTQQTKIARELSKRARYVIGLTGTPLGKSVSDLFSQYLVLDNGATLGDNRFLFEREYFYKPSIKVPYKMEPKRICSICGELYDHKLKHLEFHRISLPEYRKKFPVEKTATDLILDRVSYCTLRYSKEECLDLPDQIYQVRTVEPSVEQTQVTQEVVLGIHVNSLTESNVEYHTQKLVQITGGFLLDKEGSCEVYKTNPKLQELGETLSQISGKCIIYHYYVKESELISEYLKDMGYSFVVVNGNVSKAEQKKQIDSFINGNVQVLLANPNSGGEGIDGLQVSSTIIYYSRSYMGSILRQQSEGRIHRQGQKNNCVYIDLVMHNTIDEILFDNMSNCSKQFKSVLTYLQKKYKKG